MTRARIPPRVSVFFRSIAIVSGPTPPGTGVSAPATSATAGCTSPTTSEPRFVEASRRVDAGSEQPLDGWRSSTGVVPTSTTVAPGLTKSARDEPRPADRRDEDVRRARRRQADPASSSGRS